MEVDLKHLEFGRGTLFRLTSLANNISTPNLYLLQECFAKGAACALTQITGNAAGRSRLIPENVVHCEGCSVCITAYELREAIRLLYEPWERQEITKLADRIELKHIQSCFPHRSDATTYGIGTIFTLTNHHEGLPAETEAFMLKESDDEDYEFQILQVSGRYSGWSPGYIRCKSIEQRLTLEELWDGIKFNFYGPDKKSLIVYPETIIHTYGTQLIQSLS